MNPDDILSVPFLTRKMLAFEHATAFTLRVESRGIKTGTLTIIGMTREGIFKLSHTVAANRNVTVQDYRIPDIPIMVSVYDRDSTYAVTDCHVRVTLVVNGERTYEFCAGFVSYELGLSYPQTSLERSFPGHGRIKDIVPTNPAAGAEFNITVPVSAIWRVLTFAFALVTSATVANRRVHVKLNTTGYGGVQCFPDVDQAASLTRNYSLAHYGVLPATSNDDDILIPMPSDIWLLGGDNIATETINLQAGDDYSSRGLLVEEFLHVSV